MREIDYIIVGFGLAGMAFAKILQEHDKKFVVFDAGDKSASKVAAGLYNPVILKRYTLPWKAEEQFDISLPFFKKLGEEIGVEAFKKLPVYRVLSSIEDQNNWFTASDKPGLKRFLNPQLVLNKNKYVDAPYSLGEVNETGQLQIMDLLAGYAQSLAKAKIYFHETFDHNKLTLRDNAVFYKDLKAQRVVFAEGFGIKQNPFFNRLPLVGNKGDYIYIKAPSLRLDAAIKTSIFIIPEGDDVYKVGATYNWSDKGWEPSAEGRNELIAKLDEVISCEYEIVEHIAGMRPTTGDRRPLLGIHPHHAQVALLNGLGTRGIMMSAYLAQMLYDCLEDEVALPVEVDIMRFAGKLN
ncbi:MAG: FAD-dependent oxidoreductase [Cytophagaceae bacterium]|nr:FAD-dependent oxidoreductase [Cytophagaceae bacterium]